MVTPGYQATDRGPGCPLHVAPDRSQMVRSRPIHKTSGNDASPVTDLRLIGRSFSSVRGWGQTQAPHCHGGSSYWYQKVGPPSPPRAEGTTSSLPRRQESVQWNQKKQTSSGSKRNCRAAISRGHHTDQVDSDFCVSSNTSTDMSGPKPCIPPPPPARFLLARIRSKRSDPSLLGPIRPSAPSIHGMPGAAEHVPPRHRSSTSAAGRPGGRRKEGRKATGA